MKKMLISTLAKVVQAVVVIVVTIGVILIPAVVLALGVMSFVVTVQIVFALNLPLKIIALGVLIGAILTLSITSAVTYKRTKDRHKKQQV